MTSSPLTLPAYPGSPPVYPGSPTQGEATVEPMSPLTLERSMTMSPKEAEERVSQISPKKKRKGRPRYPQGIKFLGNSTTCKNGALSAVFKRSVLETLGELDLKEAKFLRYALSKQWGSRIKKVVNLSDEAREKQMVHLMSNLERFKAKYPSIATRVDGEDKQEEPKQPSEAFLSFKRKYGKEKEEEEKPKKKKRRITPTLVSDDSETPAPKKKRVKKLNE